MKFAAAALLFESTATGSLFKLPAKNDGRKLEEARPNCNTAADCGEDDKDDYSRYFCAPSTKTDRRKLFGRAPTYTGFCGDPKCMADDPVFYELTSQGFFDSNLHVVSQLAEQGACDPDDGLFNKWVNIAEEKCGTEDIMLFFYFEDHGMRLR
mmetsp:Transcript_14578/g.29902  ORF Transcript_14578/g.29902 Transcript_14578/m.29902 type:complete len:153 (-) Transcript_14578:490-948(-)